MVNCKNCSQTIKGNYCSNCGQSAKVERLKTSHIVDYIANDLFQFNRGLVFTIGQLFTHPGRSIQAFLSGRRIAFFKPIAYVFLLSTLYFFLSRFTDSSNLIHDFLKGYTSVKDIDELSSTEFKQLAWFAENYAYTTLFLLPLFSLASFLSFRKLKFNYFEHLVLNAYISGQQAIIYTFFALLNFWLNKNNLLISISFVLSLLYNFWVYLQFFDKIRSFSTFFRTTLTYLLFLFFLVLILGFSSLLQ